MRSADQGLEVVGRWHSIWAQWLTLGVHEEQ